MMAGLLRTVEGWTMARLGGLSEFVMGQAPPGKDCNKDGEGTPFVKAGEFGFERPVIREWTTRPLKHGSRDDIFICVVGATAGKLNLGEDCAIGRSVAAIRPSPALDQKYAYFQLIPHVMRMRRGSVGSAQGVISKSMLDEVPIALAPLPEQHRIVEAIEAHFSRLDSAVSALKRVQANLKRYRASVLKAACEGRLVPTEAELARKEGRDYEPASKLLERILEERRKRWEGKGKYKEPSGPDKNRIPHVTDGWSVCSFDECTTNHDGVRVPLKKADREKRKGPYPYYGASGVIDHIDDYVFDGTFLLVSEDGANLLARSTQIAFQATGRFWVNNHAHVVSVGPSMSMAFLQHYLNALDLRPWVRGTAQPKLTQAFLNAIPVALPPQAEQVRIVEEIERRLSVVDELEAAVGANLKRAERLRQAILKRAFEGRLVPTEHELAQAEGRSYETAEQLLARIKADADADTKPKSAKAASAPTQRKPRRKAATTKGAK